MAEVSEVLDETRRRLEDQIKERLTGQLRLEVELNMNQGGIGQAYFSETRGRQPLLRRKLTRD